MKSLLLHSCALVLGLGCVAAIPAWGAEGGTPASYRLGVGDNVEMSVSGEAELSTSQRINSDGQIRIELVGTIMIAGKTVREAETEIQNRYIEQRFLRQPMVTLRVTVYAAREAFVSGAVNIQGAFVFQPEVTREDIIVVINKSGGFTEFAKRNAVRVTRFTSEGQKTFVVQVHDMMNGRTNERFFVQPGDIILVEQSLL